VLRRRLVSLVLLVATAGACSSGRNAPEVAEQPVTTTAGAIGELARWFDGAQGQRRLLLVMSPT
jgi:hypothetical protein